MVDWSSPAEITTDHIAFTKFMHVLYGFYVWEFVLSAGFDWQLMSGTRKFRWPLVFYFAGRYILLLALTGIIVSLNLRSQVNCQALYTFNQVMSNMAIGVASINLSFRTMAVWLRRMPVDVIILVALIILGHWSLLMYGASLKAVWAEGRCVVTYTNNKILAASFIYGMVFNFLFLCLNAWKLEPPIGGRSELITSIFVDGLIYFLVAFLSHLLATIFMLLNLNTVMSVIANVPAAIASTIAASRMHRRLYNYSSKGARVSASTQGLTHAYRSDKGQRTLVIHKRSVRVQVDAFPGGTQPQQPFIEYDLSAEPQGDNFDIESQAIIEEFESQRSSH